MAQTSKSLTDGPLPDGLCSYPGVARSTIRAVDSLAITIRCKVCGEVMGFTANRFMKHMRLYFPLEEVVLLGSKIYIDRKDNDHPLREEPREELWLKAARAGQKLDGIQVLECLDCTGQSQLGFWMTRDCGVGFDRCTMLGLNSHDCYLTESIEKEDAVGFTVVEKNEVGELASLFTTMEYHEYQGGFGSPKIHRPVSSKSHDTEDIRDTLDDVVEEVACMRNEQHDLLNSVELAVKSGSDWHSLSLQLAQALNHLAEEQKRREKVEQEVIDLRRRLLLCQCGPADPSDARERVPLLEGPPGPPLGTVESAPRSAAPARKAAAPDMPTNASKRTHGQMLGSGEPIRSRVAEALAADDPSSPCHGRSHLEGTTAKKLRSSLGKSALTQSSASLTASASRQRGSTRTASQPVAQQSASNSNEPATKAKAGGRMSMTMQELIAAQSKLPADANSHVERAPLATLSAPATAMPFDIHETNGQTADAQSDKTIVADSPPRDLMQTEHDVANISIHVDADLPPTATAQDILPAELEATGPAELASVTREPSLPPPQPIARPMTEPQRLPQTIHQDPVSAPPRVSSEPEDETDVARAAANPTNGSAAPVTATANLEDWQQPAQSQQPQDRPSAGLTGATAHATNDIFTAASTIGFDDALAARRRGRPYGRSGRGGLRRPSKPLRSLTREPSSDDEFRGGDIPARSADAQLDRESRAAEAEEASIIEEGHSTMTIPLNDVATAERGRPLRSIEIHVNNAESSKINEEYVPIEIGKAQPQRRRARTPRRRSASARRSRSATRQASVSTDAAAGRPATADLTGSVPPETSMSAQRRGSPELGTDAYEKNDKENHAADIAARDQTAKRVMAMEESLTQEAAL
ncbi:hypothetical protein KEM52_003330 [Ascosphaera acerosa]|nr:hypothetical protein KEM52_003330 [Ascosphaera acerosa]